MARRNKKAVDYSQFGDADDDDDEDFASIAAPSKKKSKKVYSETKKEKKESQNKLLRGEVELQKRAANKRVALDDKLYQRDLEVALALSVSEPALGTCIVKDSQEQVLHESADERDQTGKDLGQRTAASQQKVLTGSQSSASSAHSYEPEMASAEESEANSSFSEDSHDEFPVKKATKENGKGGKTLNAKNEKAKTTTKVKRSCEVQAKPEPALKRVPSSSESTGKPLKASGSTALKRPSWTPPAGSRKSPLGGVLVKSPTQSLRLGLSRLARVKPLHPSIASV
ncbi:PREDICTED: RAD51-associated protein 1 [Gekko japonicus]|uniref:RAD51-associated protein 1 n=1 Tax=Gekko japonicus TaxID=146911 RepID=A0ABM1JYY8_GEKJA|nr:PREDICTED: RAD51-associated protein 1 [Gekko japonicus]